MILEMVVVFGNKTFQLQGFVSGILIARDEKYPFAFLNNQINVFFLCLVVHLEALARIYMELHVILPPSQEC